jgi:hypothetical protein
LVGLLPDSDSSFSGVAMLDILPEELFSVKNRGTRAVLEESQVMTPPKRLRLLRIPAEPLRRSPVKPHILIWKKVIYRKWILTLKNRYHLKNTLNTNY